MDGHYFHFNQRPFFNPYPSFAPAMHGLYSRPTASSFHHVHAINVTGPVPGFFHSKTIIGPARRSSQSGGVRVRACGSSGAASSTGKSRSQTKVRRSVSSSSTAARSSQSRTGNLKGTTKSKAAIVRTNHRKGIAFEKKIAAALKDSRSIKPRSVKTQVSTKNRGRADIVGRTTSGEKFVVEAKNFRRGNPLTKNNVKQVKGYAKALKAKPVIVASKTTKVPAKVKQYARRNNVGITKF